MYHLIPPTALSAWALKRRQYHACGQLVWASDAAPQPLFYQEVAPSSYAAVNVCPHCRGALSSESMSP